MADDNIIKMPATVFGMSTTEPEEYDIEGVVDDLKTALEDFNESRGKQNYEAVTFQLESIQYMIDCMMSEDSKTSE